MGADIMKKGLEASEPGAGKEAVGLENRATHFPVSSETGRLLMTFSTMVELAAEASCPVILYTESGTYK